jgi:hypothetical protein
MLRLNQARDDIDRELTIERFFLKFIYLDQEPWYGNPLLDERRSERAPDIAAGSASQLAKPKG